MKLIHKATGETVKKGDTVTFAAGVTATVEGWVYPKSTASSGRIGVIRQGMNTPEWFFPAVFGCEFVEREDRADEDAHMLLELNPALVRQLEDEYTRAKDKGAEQFNFSGHVLLTSYAKYLIEYAKQRLGMQ